MTSILILGAGELGKSIVTAISKHPFFTTAHITILLRPGSLQYPSASKSQELDSLRSINRDITFLPFDLSTSSEAELTSLFKSGSPANTGIINPIFDTIISCTGFTAGRGVQTKICKAVLGAGIKIFVPWQFGVDYDAIEDKFVVVRALGNWENEVTATTVEDVGILTAEVLSRGVRNEVVFVAGETISYGALAEVVSNAFEGEDVRREVWDMGFLKNELAKDPENGLWKYRVVFGAGEGVAWEREKTWNFRNGIPVMGVQEWASIYLKEV